MRFSLAEGGGEAEDDADANDDEEEEEEEEEDTTFKFEPYMIQNTRNFEQLRLKATRTAVRTASEAADVSLIYVKWALKFAALEAAHDIGFLANCQTATDAVNAVKARFPVLEDIQRAYHLGANNSSFSSQQWSPEERLSAMRAFHSEAGLRLSNDGRVAGQWDDGSIVSAMTVQPLYDPETGAEVELVFERVVPRGDATAFKIQHQASKQTKGPVDFENQQLMAFSDDDDDNGPFLPEEASQHRHGYINPRSHQVTDKFKIDDDDDANVVTDEMTLPQKASPHHHHNLANPSSPFHPSRTSSNPNSTHLPATFNFLSPYRQDQDQDHHDDGDDDDDEEEEEEDDSFHSQSQTPYEYHHHNP